MSNQSEAMRLADRLEGRWALHPEMQEIAAELRRLQARLAASEDQAERAVAGCERLRAQRDALLEAIKPLIDLAEFWINHSQKGHMCEQEFKVWLALGHESNAMLNARAAIKAVEENT